jgi:HSP20 family protein
MPNLITWKKSEIASLRCQMEDFFDRFFDELSNSCLSPGLAAFADWRFEEDDKQLVLKIAMPGLDPNDIDISLADDVLTIKAKQEEVQVQAETQNRRREKAMFSTTRSVKLPCRVKREEVSARYIDEVLEIVLPKAEKALFKVSIKA